VETRGDKTRGETVVNRRGFRLRFEEGPQYKTAVREDIEPNARICLEVDAERFVKFYVERVLN
jgi:inosine-uridine nucleoside N-ribohydrolase